MKLHSVEITNFRGIEQLDLDLDPRLTVLVGENGAGKTTILDALALLLKPYLARLTQRLSVDYRIETDDLKIGAAEAKLSMTAVDDGDPKPVQWMLFGLSEREKFIRPRDNYLDDLDMLILRPIAERQPVNDGSLLKKDNFLGGETAVIYYDQSRMLLDIDKHKQDEVGHTPTRVFAEGLEHRGIDFRELTSWFAEREMEELRDQKKRGASYVDRQLDAVRRAITGATGFSELEYTVDGQRGLKLKKQGVE
ncbi:MAG: hypothetical protein QOJ54_1483, partial [Aliidongia sp.]|nr:hypothetical protein [Aliidongia sp.]